MATFIYNGSWYIFCHAHRPGQLYICGELGLTDLRQRLIIIASLSDGDTDMRIAIRSSNHYPCVLATERSTNLL